MKRAHNTGSITRLQGNRRRPYMMRVVTGYTVNKKTKKKVPKREIIGYARTKKEAGEKLFEYYQKGKFNPAMTFRDVYDLWSQSKFPNLAKPTIVTYSSSYRACSMIHDMVFADIKGPEIEFVLKQTGKNNSMIDKIMILLRQMYKYAIAHDICSRNYADTVNVKSNIKNSPSPNAKQRNR